MIGVKANAIFAIRAYLMDKPYQCLSIGLFFSVIILACELSLFEKTGKNSLYLIIVTMTTIGYGDLFPVTYIGRCVCMIGCIWGVFIISLLTVALMKTMDFESKEDTVYDEITRRRKLSTSASGIIQLYLLLTAYRKVDGDMTRRSQILLLLLSRISRFRIERQSVQKSQGKCLLIINI
jgi:hypothetical protein